MAPLALSLQYFGTMADDTLSIGYAAGSDGWYDGVTDPSLFRAARARARWMESGVAVTHYQLAKNPVADGTSVTIDSEGVHTLQVWSVYNADNVEAQKNIEVKIDKTAPGISHTRKPQGGTSGDRGASPTTSLQEPPTRYRLPGAAAGTGHELLASPTL